MTTPRLSLEQIPDNTLRPGAVVNDAFQVLDALVQGSAREALRNVPPVTSAYDVGAIYILGDNPTDEWEGFGFQVAICTAAGEWRFFAPKVGWTFYVVAEGIPYVYHTTGWAPETRIATNTADKILALSDLPWQEMDVATENTVTVRSEVSIGWPDGRRFYIRQRGAGRTTLVAGSGVELRTASSLTTRAQNSVIWLTKIDTDEWAVAGDLDGSAAFAGGALASALDEAKGTDIASAATTDIGSASGNFVHVTGTSTITALGAAQAGTRRIVRFADALTLTHDATSLILPTAASIATAVDDCAVFVSEGAGNWRCVSYQRASGEALTTTAGEVADESITGAKLSTAIRTLTASGAAVLADANNVVQMDVATANDFTIPPNSSEPIPVGASLEVWQKGAGQTTIVEGAGVTIETVGSITLVMEGQGAGCSLRKVDTDLWRLVGQMEAA